MKEKELLTKKFILVGMNEVKASTKEKTIIGTQALATCIGVLLYSEAKKKAIVAHVSSECDAAIEKIIALLIKNDMLRTPLKYKIIPGYYEEHYNTKQKLEEFFRPLPQFTDEEISENAITTDEEYTSREFAFDASTGKFVTDKVLFGVDYHNINNEVNTNKRR